MEHDPDALTIEELADQAGVTVRTVRYYISQGLLPGPGARGKGANYSPEHLARLRLIRRLSDQHVPLAEQRQQLQRLSYPEVQALLRQDERRAAAVERAREAPSPRAYVSELLARVRATRGLPPAPLDPPAAASIQESLASVSQRIPPLSTRLREPPSSPFLDPTEAPPTPAPPPRPDSQPWRRWTLAPGVELHVHAAAHRTHARLVERLLQVARTLPGRAPSSQADAAFPAKGDASHDPES